MRETPNHLGPLIDRVRTAPLRSPPSPWHAGVSYSIGGLLAVGFAPSSDLLLVTSSQGRGVFDCLTGKRLARDSTPASDEDNWQDDFELEAIGIGPLAAQSIRISGLPGGALAVTTKDGWSLERLTLIWPEESIVLTAPGSWIYETRPDRSSVFTKLAEESEIRACGFSPTGKSVIIATTSDVTMFSRA